MYYLIYISTAVTLMDQQMLAEILTQSRKNNVVNNITGLLLYAEGTFIQALEGEEEIVMKIYKHIKNDHRHKNTLTIITGNSSQRAFSEWSMAFTTLTPQKLTELEGYINPQKKELFNDNYNNSAITVMKTFAESNNLTLK